MSHGVFTLTVLIQSLKMPTKFQYLFVYGGLLPGLRLHSHMAGATLCGPAKVHGYLYDIGSYPGMVMAPSGDTSTVQGLVYAVDDAHLQRLDQLEGYVEGQTANSHYIRTEVALLPLVANLPKRALTYWFNQSLQGCARIASGDYQTHCARAAGSQLA